MRKADALLLVTPEYNASIPGVFKNAIDWLSRPPKDIPSVFGGKAVAVIGATPGSYGTLLSQTAWLPVLRALGLDPWFGRSLYLSRASTAFDDAGQLIDEATTERLRRLITEYAESIRMAVARRQ
jgi:NAD(P)H-dependent FMN reductase